MEGPDDDREVLPEARRRHDGRGAEESDAAALAGSPVIRTVATNGQRNGTTRTPKLTDVKTPLGRQIQAGE
jgi:hypothetical protein